VEAPFAVCLGGTEHGNAILGTISYGHAWDRGIVCVNDDTLDALSKLGLFDNYKFSNCLGRSGEECA
jgi:hypothetical protein